MWSVDDVYNWVSYIVNAEVSSSYRRERLYGMDVLVIYTVRVKCKMVSRYEGCNILLCR